MSEIDDLTARLAVPMGEAVEIRRRLARLKDRAAKRDAWARRQGFATRDEFEAARQARRARSAADRNEGRRNADLAHLTPEQKKERQRAQQKAWREANPDRVKGYRKAHKPAHKVHERNRRHRVRANTPREQAVTARQIEAMRARIGKRCAVCRAEGETTIDHIVPIARGGQHVRSNIQFLCMPCNSAKRDLPMEDFARTAGLLC